MKHVFCLFLAVATSLSAFAADSPSDAKAVQGSWKPIKAELAGQPMADAVLKNISLKLDRGKYEVLVGEHAGVLGKNAPAILFPVEPATGVAARATRGGRNPLGVRRDWCNGSAMDTELFAPHQTPPASWFPSDWDFLRWIPGRPALTAATDEGDRWAEL